MHHLGDPSVFEELILRPLLPGGEAHTRLVRHSDSCDSSCYDCLRDFGNAGEHALLDWRLGLDLLQIASEPTPRPPGLTGHWDSVTLLATQSLQNAIVNSLVEYAFGLPCIIRDGKLQCVLTHPLWPVYHDTVRRLADQLSVSVSRLPLANVFDAVRRPGAIVSRVTSATQRLPIWNLTTSQGPTEIRSGKQPLSLCDLPAKLPQRGEFELILTDERLDRISPVGSTLTFEKLRRDTKTDELRGKIVIAEDPTDKSKVLLGKLHLQPLQDNEGRLTEVRVALQPQSRGEYQSHRWTIPIANWPDAFYPMAKMVD